MNTTIKRRYCILIICSFFLPTLFSQDTPDREKPKNYTYFGPILQYNYYGVPFFIDIGYQYRNNYSNIFFPLIGISAEPGKHSFNFFINAKIEYRYERLYTIIGFKQGIIPFTGNNYTYKNLEGFGQFKLGYFFDNTDLSYNIDAGNRYILDFTTKDIVATFQLSHYIKASTLLYNNAANTLSLKTLAKIDVIPYHNQYSYEFSLQSPYSYYHYWGEFGIMPSIQYFQYFKNSQRPYAIGENYLASIGMTTIASTLKSHEALFNLISTLHIEYKFYLRFLPDAFRSIHLVTFANIGYGKQLDKPLSTSTLLYATGAGIGYALFGLAPLQMTIGIDQSKNITINFAVSTILH